MPILIKVIKTKTQTQLRSHFHRILVNEFAKVELSSFGNKRFLLENGVSSPAYGHYKIGATSYETKDQQRSLFFSLGGIENLSRRSFNQIVFLFCFQQNRFLTTVVPPHRMTRSVSCFGFNCLLFVGIVWWCCIWFIYQQRFIRAQWIPPHCRQDDIFFFL